MSVGVVMILPGGLFVADSRDLARGGMLEAIADGEDDGLFVVAELVIVGHCVCYEHIAFEVAYRSGFLLYFVKFTIYSVPSVGYRPEVDGAICEASHSYASLAV